MVDTGTPKKFQIDRCPHCSVYKPHLSQVTFERHMGWELITHAVGGDSIWWVCYQCSGCSGVLLVKFCRSEMSSDDPPSYYWSPLAFYPKAVEGANKAIPDTPRGYLDNAINTIHEPPASIMVCASSVDAMLKELKDEKGEKDKNYQEGSLYERIERAANEHLITKSMKEWAHEVRLDANNQRHADENMPPPTLEDAQRSIEFAKALAEYLYVLPAKVQQGMLKRSQDD